MLSSKQQNLNPGVVFIHRSSRSSLTPIQIEYVQANNDVTAHSQRMLPHAMARTPNPIVKKHKLN